MNIHEFKKRVVPGEPFTIHQARAAVPSVAPSTLTRWTQAGYIIRLRRGLYIFPDDGHKPGAYLRFSNLMYQPSYVSTHTALSFYGFIPEGVVQVTAVSPRKTITFSNTLGNYVYQSLSTKYFWGWEWLPSGDAGSSLLIAPPEKALLDLLWLNMQYQTELDYLNLRLDCDLMQTAFDKERFLTQAERFESSMLLKRAKQLLHAYE